MELHNVTVGEHDPCCAAASPLPLTAVMPPGLAMARTAGDGEVWIAPEEAERIAAHLGLSVQRCLQRYTRATSEVAGFRQLKAKKNPVS
jgi:hypothetical protein